MNTEQGFTLQPGAAQDITDIWEFIVEDNPLAARRYVKTFWTPFESSKAGAVSAPRTQET